MAQSWLAGGGYGDASIKAGYMRQLPALAAKCPCWTWAMQSQVLLLHQAEMVAEDRKMP
jgi:hypothetical protein